MRFDRPQRHGKSFRRFGVRIAARQTQRHAGALIHRQRRHRFLQWHIHAEITGRGDLIALGKVGVVARLGA